MASNEQDLLWVYNPTKTAFTVKWGGHPYTLQSGEKKVMPRFIAEHFAKHLADAILLRKEQVESERRGKPVALVNSPVERPKIVSMIVLDVYSYFQDPQQSPGDQIANMVNEVNRGVDTSVAPATPADDGTIEDYGLVPNKAMGTLKEPDTPAQADINAPPADTPENDGSLLPVNDQATEAAPGKKPPSLKQLRAEADQMGVVYGDNETADQIKAKLLAEAG